MTATGVVIGKIHRSIHAAQRIIAASLIAVLAGALPCAAADSGNETIACFTSAAERNNIPVELLLAVAEVESGLKPYAMNSAGSAYLPTTREEAQRVLERLAGRPATFDVGIMQVNRWWYEKYGEPYEKGLDVCANTDFGARILAMAIRDHGFTWEAVGRYHSPTSWRKARYAKMIFSRLSRIMEKRRDMPAEEYMRERFAPRARERLASSLAVGG